MKITPSRVLPVLHVVSWIVFVGIGIKVGAMIVSFIVTLFSNNQPGFKLYPGLDLSGLYLFDQYYYILMMGSIILITMLKAHMMYQVIRIFQRINLSHPFSEAVSRLITSISYTAFSIGVFTMFTNNYYEWLMKRGASFPPMDNYLGSAEEFFLLAGIVFVIAQVFKKGIEIQSENELTV